MSTFCLIYGIISIILWISVSLLTTYFHLPKFWKKHLKRRKKIFFFFALLAFILFWINLEKAIQTQYLYILWGIHLISFVSYIFGATKKIISDKKRIQKIQERKKNHKN